MARPKPKRSPKKRRVSYKKRCEELEGEISSLRETAAVEQGARVAMEQVIGTRLDEIEKLLKGKP